MAIITERSPEHPRQKPFTTPKHAIAIAGNISNTSWSIAIAMTELTIQSEATDEEATSQKAMMKRRSIQESKMKRIMPEITLALILHLISW